MDIRVPERHRFPLVSPLLAAALAVLVLSGCAQNATTSRTVDFFDDYLPVITQFGVYKLDINQGNYISQDMVDKLKVGQTKPQVRAALGTPLVVSVFRDNRWDYVYEFQRAGRVREHRQFTVYFNKDESLARWEGDEMPPSVQDLNRVAATRTLPEDPYGQDAGILGKVIDIFRNIWDPGAPPVK
jgi:outer membrane protein assembly factor BamE